MNGAMNFRDDLGHIDSLKDDFRTNRAGQLRYHRWKCRLAEVVS